jgi:hypothetical protein
MELYERSTWLNPKYEYLFGKRIVEYDMQSAGLSLVKEYHLLDDKTIKSLDDTIIKKDRVVKLGLIQRKDKKFAKALSDAFVDARKRFFQANNLNEDNILSIKKDAFFTIDTECEVTELGKMNFRPKHKYSSFIKLNRIEFYLDTIGRAVDIKGLGQGAIHEKLVELHIDYMLDFILTFARGREVNTDLEVQSKWLSTFVKRYRHKELDIGYYRELSQTMDFKVNSEEGLLSMNDCSPAFLDDIDISYNYYNYIVPLISIII